MRLVGKSLPAVVLSVAFACAGQQTSRVEDTGSGNGEEVVIAASGPVALGNEPVLLVLQVRDLASRLNALAPDQHIYLVFRNLYAAEQPGVLYHVLFDLPPAVKPEKDDVHYVGTLNFYNAVALAGGKSSPNPGVFRSYDVTLLIKNLQQRKLLSEQTTITVSPSGVPAAKSKPMIGRIELVAQ